MKSCVDKGGVNALTLRSGAPQRPGSRYAAKASETTAAIKRSAPICVLSESPKNRMIRSRYNPRHTNIATHNAMNTSLSKMCQPYAKSATDRNFNDNANSTKPRITFIVFSHPPDFGRPFNHDGNIANTVKGTANAIANPNIPTAGPTTLPCVTASTSSVPIIGPVHENETSTKVNAIRNKLIRPVVFPALLLTAFVNPLGIVISKTPKNETANTTSKIKNSTLNHALVAISLSVPGPKATVITSPKSKYMTIIDNP